MYYVCIIKMLLLLLLSKIKILIYAYDIICMYSTLAFYFKDLFDNFRTIKTWYSVGSLPGVQCTICVLTHQKHMEINQQLLPTSFYSAI